MVFYCLCASALNVNNQETQPQANVNIIKFIHLLKTVKGIG